jgi:hypothetical protein
LGREELFRVYLEQIVRSNRMSFTVKHDVS